MFEELLKSIIREVFTSKDMQDYLCENAKALADWQIVNIVRRAFIPLIRKKELFEVLSVYEDREVIERELEQVRKGENQIEEFLIKENSYYYQAQFISRALEKLMIKDKSEGLLLLIEYRQKDGNEQQVGVVPFYSYEKLCDYVREKMETEITEEVCENCYWYSIERYMENSEGNLEEIYVYYCFGGEVIYCDGDEFCMGNIYPDLNVPVPFKQGDIICCEGGPTCDDTTAVLIRTGDNIDCCSLVALCKRSDDTLEHEPVKHSDMFFDTKTGVYVPPLYSARKVDDLTDEYAALRKISDFINGDEDRGYIVERNVDKIPMSEITDEWIAYLEQDYEKWKNKIKGREF